MASLSKSKYQAGLQCHKQLWLQCNRYKDRDPLTPEQQARFAHGTEVGRMAQQLFPDGVLITENHFQADAAIAKTLEAMQRGAVAVFEAAFRFRNLLVRADLIHRNEATGQWDLHEVKSSGRVYPNHVTDAAIQAWDMEGNGIRVGGIYLTHPVRDGGIVPEGGNPEDYFESVDIAGEARSHISEVDRNVDEQNRIIVLPEPPAVPFGPQCEVPYRCSHYDYCHRMWG